MGVDIRVRVKGGGHVSQIYGKKMSLLSKLKTLINHQIYYSLLMCTNEWAAYLLNELVMSMVKCLYYYRSYPRDHF